jgi:hypothetical protein
MPRAGIDALISESLGASVCKPAFMIAKYPRQREERLMILGAGEKQSACRHQQAVLASC